MNHIKEHPTTQSNNTTSNNNTQQTEQVLIYVLDDDIAMCESLCWLLQSMHWQVKTFHTPESFLKHYNPEYLSCLILDVRMPGMSGLGLQDTLKEKGIDIPLIFITGHGDVRMAVRAMKAGAMEFLNKPFNDQELLDSIHRSLNIAKKTRQRKQERKHVQKRLNSLTARELEILQQLVQGKMNKVIAHELSLSIKTVELHRSNIMRKFKSPTMTALLSLLYQHHIDFSEIAKYRY